MAIDAMAALGSSFAAGPGIAPVGDKKAMRSDRNYAHLAARMLGATLIDATISGASTETILMKPQRLGFNRFAPQIEQITPAMNLDLVTITAGGNDLGYLGSLLKAALAEQFSRQRALKLLGRRMRSEPVPVTEDQIDRTTSGLISIVEAVAECAPGARILLVDYLTIVGPATQASAIAPFTHAELANFRRTGQKLAEAFAAAASDTSAELIQASALSEAHALDSLEPWVNGFQSSLKPAILSSSFHPNADGMAAVAEAIVGHVSTR